MPATENKSLDDLRTEVGDHLTNARKELREAAKIADKLAMRRTHHHTLLAISHVDDALSLLAETGGK